MRIRELHTASGYKVIVRPAGIEYDVCTLNLAGEPISTVRMTEREFRELVDNAPVTAE